MDALSLGTEGDPPGYASFILATLDGVRQVVGYDVASLGGWDPDTERDVWSHPALVGNRLYIRNLLGAYCFLLSE